MTPLEESIKHWKTDILEPVIAGQRVLRKWFGDDCELCQAHPDCYLCPVALNTGKKQCKGTPWTQASLALSDYEDNVKENTQETAIVYVRKMIAYLEKLK